MSTGLRAFVLSTPDALLASLPYLLGFPPAESAVLLWLRDKRILLTQRVDLPASAADNAPWVTAVWGHVAAQRADEVLIVVATSRPDAADRLNDLRVHAQRCGVRVREAIILREGRWCSALCASPGCCPPEGRPVDPAVTWEVAAEFTADGIAPAPDRATLVRECAADDIKVSSVGVELDTMPQLRKTKRWRAQVIVTFLKLVDDAAARSRVRDLTTVIAGLDDIRIRDTVLWEISVADRSRRFAALEVLMECTRSAPEHLVAPAATCAAITAWLVGDGARARIAVERALLARPGYTLAGLVEHSLRVGLPPSAWTDALAGLSRAECLDGAPAESSRESASGVVHRATARVPPGRAAT